MQPAEGIQRLQSIRIVPVGSLARAVGERLTARVSRHVALPCHFDGTRLEGELRFLPGRAQADADHLLRRLEEHGVDASTVVVGITDVDLGLSILTYVFGGARAGGHTAVVSLARLKQEFYGLPVDEELLARRAVAEVLHEVGHIAGLAHCPRYDCIMHFAADVEKVDLRGLSFCADCAAGMPAGFLPEKHA